MMRRREFLAAGATVAAARGQTFVTEIEKQVPALLAEFKVPGLSIAVIQRARLRWRRGFGVSDRESGKTVTIDTMFEAASMSKPVFAYAALKLCERGVLGLDTPITQYTPERFLDGDPRLDLMTPRHVLSHSGGFQNWRSDKEPLRIHFPPGSQYQYSGEGYNYLQAVVTRVTRQTFEPFMTANLFAPFGMKSSGYLWSDRFAKLMARPHDPEGKPAPNKKANEDGVARYGAAGELLTTPSDYARFLIEVMQPKPADRFRLGAAMRADMLRPQVKVTAGDGYTISWGLGWRIAETNEATLVGHGGNNLGFHSISEMSIGRKSGYVIMTNGENGYKLIEKLAPAVSRLVHGLAA